MKIKFYGTLLELVMKQEIEIDKKIKNCADLKQELENRYHGLSGYAYKISLNGKLSTSNENITEEDEIIIFSPIVGG